MRFLALFLLLAGCSGSPWPEPGQGGMAEARWPSPLIGQTAPDGLEERLRCVLAGLESTQNVAIHRGTDSGTVAILELSANRVRREFTGQFYRDVALSLERLANDTNRFRADLGLPANEGCT